VELSDLYWTGVAGLGTYAGQNRINTCRYALCDQGRIDPCRFSDATCCVLCLAPIFSPQATKKYNDAQSPFQHDQFDLERTLGGSIPSTRTQLIAHTLMRGETQTVAVEGNRNEGTRGGRFVEEYRGSSRLCFFTRFRFSSVVPSSSSLIRKYSPFNHPAIPLNSTPPLPFAHSFHSSLHSTQTNTHDVYYQAGPRRRRCPPATALKSS